MVHMIIRLSDTSVRVGPFTKRDDAEQLKEKLDGAGLESALVRVQR